MSLENREYNSEMHPNPKKWRSIMVEGLAPTYWADLSREARGGTTTRKPIKVLTTTEEAIAAIIALSGSPGLGVLIFAHSKSTEYFDILHQKKNQWFDRWSARINKREEE